jgi:hypothetical protein
MRTTLLTFIAVLVAAPSAWSFEQPEDRPASLRLRPEASADVLESSAPWQRFVALQGPAWRARVDARTGQPFSIVGEGIEVGDGGVEALQELVAMHGGLLGRGVGPGDLVPAHDARIGEVRYLVLQQQYRGVPVVGGRVHARVKHGRIPLLGMDTVPGLDLPVTPTLGAAAALRALEAELPSTGLRAGPELVVLPRWRHPGDEDRLAWLFEVADRLDPERPRWERRYLDAHSGKVLVVEDLVRWAAGTIEAEVGERSPGDPLVPEPMPFLFVDSTTGSTATDLVGDYDTGGASTEVDLAVRGEHIGVHNEQGPDAAVTAPQGPFLWTAQDASQAELSAYVYLNQAWQWARALSPGLGYLINGFVDTYVNIDDRCNAYFSIDDQGRPSFNFYRAGGPCNNTALVADIVYHEFAHSYHIYSMFEAGNFAFDGALGEGQADYLACSMVNDPVMGRGFLTNGSSIRSCDNTARWPDDIDGDPHITGLIISGALWDLREALILRHGQTAGVQAADRIYAGILPGSTDIPSTFDEALVADDNDGNLANGTPNHCAISDAFAAHGLGTGDVTNASLRHTPIRFQTAGVVRYPAVAWAPFSQCDPNRLGEGTLYWEIVGGGAGEVALVRTPGGVAADIPRAPGGSLVRYRFEVDDNATGGTLYLPLEDETEEWYQFRVGPRVDIWCDDMESGENGWSHALDAGDPGAGADDWQLGPPNGRSGDPSSAHSANNVWANDLGQDDWNGANWNGAYQGNKINHLESAPIDTTGFERVHIGYRRWLTVEDATFDHARLYVNGTPVWENAASAQGDIHHVDRHWFYHEIDISELADDRAEVVLRFELETDAGLEMGGWTLDDLCLFSLDPEAIARANPVGGEEDGSFLVGDEAFTVWRGDCSCESTGSGRPALASVWMLLAMGLARRRRLP